MPSRAKTRLSWASLTLLLSGCAPQPSVREGQLLYRANGCASCHGPSGRADGPLAATLPVTPPDLRYPDTFGRGSAEAEIAQTIAAGIPLPAGTSPHLRHANHTLAMPSFAHLTERERRSIARYVLSLRDNR